MSEAITPIRQQYLEIKANHPDEILFFRLGDFYETFDEDAQLVSKELDLVLTSRNVAKGTRIPMAGIPYHAVDNYLARLISKGYHVAICEQIGEVPAKGLFPRKVVKIVTPGTVLEPALLPGGHNNYLAAYVVESGNVGLAYADVSTGEFQATQFDGEQTAQHLVDELARLNPSEVLRKSSAREVLPEELHVTPLPDWKFEFNRARELIKTQFDAATLDGFGLQSRPQAVQAAGVLLHYLQETQPASLPLLNRLSYYDLTGFMNLDATTLQNLEVTETLRKAETKGSLLYEIDHTISPMGKRQIRQWLTKPLIDLTSINARQESVAWFAGNGMLRTEFRKLLKEFADIERIINRVAAQQALPGELAALRHSLHKLSDVRALLSDKTSALEAQLRGISDVSAEAALLERAIAEEPPATLQRSGVIRPGYSAELDEVVENTRHAREWIANLEVIEKASSGIKTLKVGYNKVFGYYIEVTRGNKEPIPENYIRKQTLVNAERYITPELKEYESLVLNAEENIRQIEAGLFREVCKRLSASREKILAASQAIAELDVLASFAETSVLNQYTRPILSENNELMIRGGRHPVVEKTMGLNMFVPNDTIFEEGELIRLITGPNMSGKSTFLRQVALIVLLAQVGCFVPADQAEIGIVDRIFTRLGGQDEIHRGYSTFMVEMIETANILNHATSRSLLILDEIGRGTSTYDGVSIAWAVIEYLHNHPRLKSRTLFATHYHELLQLSKYLPGVRNYNVSVTEVDGQVVFLHKIIAGGSDRSYGIHVGQLAGIPKPVVQRAYELLRQLEANSSDIVDATPRAAEQMGLFPETNPLLDEIQALDLNNMSPVSAMTKLYEWQQRYGKSEAKA